MTATMTANCITVSDHINHKGEEVGNDQLKMDLQQQQNDDRVVILHKKQDGHLQSETSGSDSGHELETSVSGSSSGSKPSSVASNSSSSSTEPEDNYDEDDEEDDNQHDSMDDNDKQQVDCFEDASEYFEESTTTTTNSRLEPREADWDLKGQLEEVRHVLDLALNNQFKKALEMCEPRANEELYSGLAYATLCFLRAALTMDPNDLQAAVDGINRTQEVASKARRKTNVFARFLYKPNYDHYSEEQIHAELVEAESLLLLSLISFLSDQSVICLVRSALRIRTCYQRYKECLHIMKTRKSWSSELAKRHFESGVQMGYGTFNLLMSYLPRRVLRILEYVGFSGNRTIGVTELDKSIAQEDGLRSTLSALITLLYHSYIENVFGLGHYEPEKVEQVSELLLRQHPESAFFLLFRGRYHQMQGRLDQAIENFQKSIEAQDDWPQFHSICHWEIMWCYAGKLMWCQAAHYADLLRQRSKWSPASYTYQYATFLYAQLMEDQRNGHLNDVEFDERLEEIAQLMAKVPTLRVRLAGKTIPAEKFAIVRSGKFLEEGNRLCLPALEILYIWNLFVFLKNCPTELEKMLARIEQEMKYTKHDQIFDSQTKHDNKDKQQKAKISSTAKIGNDDDDAGSESDSDTGSQLSGSEMYASYDKNSSSSGVHSTPSQSSCETSTSFGQRRPAGSHPTSAFDDKNNKDKTGAINDSTEQQIGAQTRTTDHDNKPTRQQLLASSNRNDDFFILLLLKGMCLKQLNRFEEAEQVLSQLIDSNELIKEDTFLVPHGGMELALLKLDRRQFNEAKQIIRRVRNEHSGYLHETMVHFKVHAANRYIRLEQQQEQDEELRRIRSASSAKSIPPTTEGAG